MDSKGTISASWDSYYSNLLKYMAQRYRHSIVLVIKKMKWLVFKATILHCKAILGRGQPGWMRWILLCILPLAQDRSLDLLAKSPARYEVLVISTVSIIKYLPVYIYHTISIYHIYMVSTYYKYCNEYLNTKTILFFRCYISKHFSVQYNSEEFVTWDAVIVLWNSQIIRKTSQPAGL